MKKKSPNIPTSFPPEEESRRNKLDSQTRALSGNHVQVCPYHHLPKLLDHSGHHLEAVWLRHTAGGRDEVGVDKVGIGLDEGVLAVLLGAAGGPLAVSRTEVGCVLEWVDNEVPPKIFERDLQGEGEFVNHWVWCIVLRWEMHHA